MPYQQQTLDGLRDYLTRRWDGAVFWSPEEAQIAINETLRDWNLLTGRWRQTLAVDTLAGEPTINSPATLLYGMRVRYGSPTTWISLHPTSMTELDLGRPSWRVETTATGGAVPTQPLLWAPESLQRLVIWPATAVDTTELLWLDGVAATPILGEDADYVDLGEEHMDLLVDYALHCLLFKEGGERWRNTLPTWKAFLEGAAQENGRIKRSQKYRRLMGLDRRRDLQPPIGAPTRIDDLGQIADPQR